MTEKNKQVLNKLSNEQLIYLIEQLLHSQFVIGEVLVDESKQHIASDRAIDKIRRECMCDVPSMNDANALKAYIDMKMGVITVEEYRILMGFSDQSGLASAT